MLKEIVGNRGGGHDIGELAREFEVLIQGRYGQAPPPWIAESLMDLAAIDPGSTAFRYGENYDRATKRHVPIPLEVYVDLQYLRMTMKALNDVLSRVLDENRPALNR